MKPRPPKPFPMVRQNATGDLGHKPFKFQESDFPFAYANLHQYIGLKKNDYGYVLVRMGEHLHFYAREEQQLSQQPVAQFKLVSPRIRQRMNMFQNKNIEADSIGWKLHISVDPRDIEAAWTIICPILLATKMSAFKIITPDVLQNALSTNKLGKVEGKQFTIYQFRNPNMDKDAWEDVIKNIEGKLQEANIRPTTMPKANKVIEGSNYFSYRNDTDSDKPVYISDADAEAKAAKNVTLKAYNLTGADDPYEDVRPFQGKRLSY